MARSDAAIWRFGREESRSLHHQVATHAEDDPPPASPMSPGDLEMRQIAAAQQDVNAFAPLYEHYVDIVWRYARSRLGDSDLAANGTGGSLAMDCH